MFDASNAGAAVGPARADLVEDLRDVGQRLGMFRELRRRGRDDVIGLGEVDVHRHIVLLAGFANDVGEIVGGRRRAPPRLRCAVHQFQTVGHQTRLVHAVPRFLDQFRDVDAHRAGERAPAAEGAGVVEQRLPFLEHVDLTRWT